MFYLQNIHRWLEPKKLLQMGLLGSCALALLDPNHIISEEHITNEYGYGIFKQVFVSYTSWNYFNFPNLVFLDF